MLGKNMESGVSPTEKSCPIFQVKDHEVLAIVDPLDNVYLANPMLAHSLRDMGNQNLSPRY